MTKIYYLFFLALLCIVNETTASLRPKGKDCERHRNEKIYFHDYNKKISFPIVQITHEINLCFHDAFLSIETDLTLDRAKNRTKRIITSCRNHMEKLRTIIQEDFDTFQRTSLKKVFKCMKESASKEAQDIITTQVLNLLEWPNRTATNALGNSIARSLQAIHEKLPTVAIDHITAQESCNRLKAIQQEYYDFLKCLDHKMYNQDFYPPISRIDKAVQTFTGLLTTPQLDRVKLFRKKEYLERQLKETPSLCPCFLQDISSKANMLSWVPFLDTKYVIVKIITLFAGQEAYDKLKKNSYFKAFRLLHKNNIIRLTSLFTTVHNLLETRPARFIIDKEVGTYFAEHSCNLQEYFFIGLCEEINRAHHNSLAMIKREKPFSFVMGKKMKENDDIQAKNSSVWITDNIIGENITPGIIDNFVDTLESIPTKTRTMISSVLNFVGSCVYSMLPDNTPPKQMPAISNNPPKPISHTFITGDIKAFLSRLPQPTNPDLMSVHRQLPSHKAFLNIVKIHKELTSNIKIVYGVHHAHNKKTPKTWDVLLSKMDELHNKLCQLKETRNQLRFFNFWGAIVNFIERNNTIKSLKEHIDIYNKIKINIYAEDSPYYDGVAYQFNADRKYKQDKFGCFHTTSSDPYKKTRKAFMAHCQFSQADNNDIFRQVTQKGSPCKEYLNAFNPLEQAELRHSIK